MEPKAKLSALFDSVACYTMAFSVRSGSNVLCDYLALNGLGAPTEYFQYPFGVVNRWLYDELQVSPGDFRTLLERLVAVKSPHGVFGVKLSWDQKNALLAACRQIDPDIAALEDVFQNSRWIQLLRADKIDQAISFWRAKKTGQWTSHTTKPAPPTYDFFGILTCYFIILTEEALWADYFVRRGISPLVLGYEAMLKDPAATIEAVLRFVRPEQPLPKEGIRMNSTYKVQRDSSSKGYHEKFVRDLDHIGDFGHWQQQSAVLGRLQAFFAEEGWYPFTSCPTEAKTPPA